MTKMKRQDYIAVLILSGLFLLFTFYLTGFKYEYGSRVDWENQHVIIAEYLRNMFYSNFDLSPDFAMNIGGGQNIYNISYYGLFNPYVVISYLFPFVDMIDYIKICSRVIVILSIFLMYLWLKRNSYSSKICFFITLLFATATPIIFHSHRHIMFINYFPFLILGLIGVDLWLEKKKSWLISLSVLLIILSSYFFSICCILVLCAYALYRYLSKIEKVHLKEIIAFVLKLVLPILTGVLMSCILIVPTFFAIMNGRSGTGQLPGLSLFIPNFLLYNFVYNPYSLGVVSFVLFAVIAQLMSKKKHNRFLSIVILCIWALPLAMYILNGTLYINEKVLIPFLPIVCLNTAEFTSNLFEKKKFSIIAVIIFISIIISNVLFYKSYYTFYGELSYFMVFLIDTLLMFAGLLTFVKFNKKILLIAPVCFMSIMCSVIVNKYDKYVPVKDYKTAFSNVPEQLIHKVTDSDKGFYRFSNEYSPHETVNKIYAMNYYVPTLYSSVNNRQFNYFCFNKMNNEMSYRNSTIMHASKNVLFNSLMGQKYIITDTNPQIGYEFQDRIGKISLYKNDNVLPIGYSTSKLINKNKYDELKYPYSMDVLLNSIVVDKNIDSAPQSNIEKAKLPIASKENTDLILSEKNGTYEIIADNNAKLNLKLKEPIKNKVLIIRFNMDFQQSGNNDTYIIINGVKNKLSAKSCPYPNKNFVFDFVISSNKDIDNLDILFKKGKYVISGIDTYTLDYENIKNITKSVDKLNVDARKVKGDKISGDINVTKDGYFILTIPYDKGFNVSVDGKKVPYEKVNESFIGFPIKQGHHKINIRYKAPMKSAGALLTAVGVIMFVAIIIYDKKRYRKSEIIENITDESEN